MTNYRTLNKHFGWRTLGTRPLGGGAGVAICYLCFRFYGWRHAFIPWDHRVDGVKQNKAAG